jgi:hypothetical protein
VNLFGRTLRLTGIDLRSDLRNLSDVALATLLEQALRRAEANQENAWPYNLHGSWRGPIRHPWFYPFTSFAAYSGPGFFGIGPVIGDFLLGSRRRALRSMHLALCEARDISDEIDCRYGARQESVP